MQIGHFSDTNWTKRTLSETNYQTDGSLATSNMSAYSPTNNTQPTLSKCPIKHSLRGFSNFLSFEGKISKHPDANSKTL